MELTFRIRTCLLIFSAWTFNGKEIFADVPMVSVRQRNVVNTTNGGSLTITCEVDTDVNYGSVNLMTDSNVQVYVFPPCTWHSSDNKNEAYNVTCSNNKLFTMIKYNINNSEHGKSWMCQILANSGPCLTACVSDNVIVHVRVPVTTVQLTDDADQLLVTSVSVSDGFNKTLRCNTFPNGSRPAASFLWYMRHENQSYKSIDDQSIIPVPNPKQVPGQPTSDLVISYSTLMFMPQRSHNNMYLRCAAKDNTYSATLVWSGEVQIFVQYAPTVHLYPDNTNYNVMEGTENLMLNCNVIDANPKLQLNAFIWLKDGTNISGQTSLSYTIQSVKRSDNGQYLCKAKNVIGDGISNPLTIHVQYKPEIYPLVETNVEEGQNLEVTCNVSAYPSSSVSWTRSGREMSTSALLQIHSILRNQSGNYTCMALNVLRPTNMSPVINNVSDILRVHVLYGPGNSTSLSNHSSLYTVEEGSKALDIVCQATCNPKCSYYWKRQNRTITNTSTLVLGVVKRDNTGLYNCTAYNTFQGQTRKSTVSLKLIIKYAPNVSIQLYGSAKLNTSATLECTPHGEPPQYTFHEWIHMVGETEIRRLTGTLTGNSSSITLSNISIQDLGLYTCTVENSVTGLNGQLNQTAYNDLYIEGPPVFAETQVMFTGEINRSTMIKIPVYSKSSIKILKLIKHSDSSDIMNISETSFRMKLANFSMPFYKKKAMISGYEAILIFYNLKDTDFDNYTLHLQNALGNNSLEFSLFASGRPQPVFRFYFNRLIGDKIELHFDPGFNGGHNQSFVIEYMSIFIHGSSWENTSINGLQERDKQYRLLPNGTFSVNLTKPSPGPYLYRMYSWNVKGQSPLSDNILIIIPRVAEDETNRSDPLLAAMPVIVGMGAGMAVLTIALVVVILRKRSYGSKSEGNIAPRYEGLRLVPTAMINEMPAEYDSIREDDNPYIEMHDHSAENNEINLRLESGRVMPESAANEITCNVYDSPTSSKAEVYSYVEPLEVRKERNETAIARSKIRRVMNPVPLTNATSNITDVSGMNKADVHSYLEVQDCTVDDREETHAKSEVGRVIVQSSMNNATCYDYESPVGSLTDHSTYEPKGASGRP